MMPVMPTILSLLLLAVLLAPIDGFGVQPKGSLSSLLSENSRRRSSLRYQNEESPTSSVLAPVTTKDDTAEANSIIQNNSMEKTETTGWDLREDWALQDSVPRYTVGSDSSTFWTQLRHSTPELSKRSETELEERYNEWYSSAEDLLLVECGPSPVLLSDWRVSTAAPLPSHSTSKQTTASTTMMSGSLPNGSQIWFPLKCAGTLGDDPMSCAASPQSPITQDTLDDCFISASMTRHMSSYAESTGGVVYELGSPRCEAHKVHGPRDSLDASMGITTVHATSVHEDPKDVAGHLDQFQRNFGKNVGTLSAIVAASTMSACLTLGYAGSHMVVSPSVTQNRQGDVVAMKHNDAERMQYATSSQIPEVTIGERRARAELKVGRDKRSLVLMQDRLQKDEAKLKELQQEEYNLEAAEWGYK